MAETKSGTTKSRGNEAKSDRQASVGSEAVRQVASQSGAFVKDLSERTRATAEETTKVLEETRSTAAKGATDLNRQWLEMIRTNTSSTLDFMHQLAGAKSPTEFFELSAAHYRRQLHTYAEQTQHLMGLAQRVATDSIAPAQTGMMSALTTAAS